MDTGFRPTGTAGDVIRYEQEELGNDYGLNPKKYDKYPAAQVIWACKFRKDALRYKEWGNPESFDIPDGTFEILAEDGDGGYLILMKDKKK